MTPVQFVFVVGFCGTTIIFQINNKTMQYEENAAPEEILSDEQLSLIEKNRQRAIERRKQISEAACGCGNTSVDIEILKTFEEVVCSACRRSCDDFELISKTVVMNEYLLSDSSIQLMKFVAKPNPHNSRWTEMRLYLRFTHHIDSACHVMIFFHLIENMLATKRTSVGAEQTVYKLNWRKDQLHDLKKL